MKNCYRQPYADLTSKVIEKRGIQKRGAEKNIKQALDGNIITKNHAGMYYSNENNETVQDDELPF
ncbi:hypothetical protein Barb6_02662 [Bacteroidales bacterium Barb6]|nr:hypothetical protein Barb6_02662 [Bacteroidales bacterium Barb6]